MAGVDPNREDVAADDSLFTGFDPSSAGSLVQAVLRNDVGFIRNRLQQDGGNTSSRHNDNRGWTALHHASFRGRSDLVRLLIQFRDASIEDQTHLGETPLFLACDAGQLLVVKLLIERGADCDKENLVGIKPLFVAAYRGHWDVVQFLGEFVLSGGAGGASILPKHLVDHGYNNILHLLCTSPEDRQPRASLTSASPGSPHYDRIRGFQVDENDENDENDEDDEDDEDDVPALMVMPDVVSGGLFPVGGRDWYRRRNPQVDDQRDNRREAFGHFIAKLDVAKGCAGAANSCGATPLHLAVKLGDAVLAESLLAAIASAAGPAELNAQVNRRCGDAAGGLTPLMLAAAAGEADLVRLLMVSGANVNDLTISLADNRLNGMLPLHFACERGSPECVALLAPRTDPVKESCLRRQNYSLGRPTVPDVSVCSSFFRLMLSRVDEDRVSACLVALFQHLYGRKRVLIPVRQLEIRFGVEKGLSDNFESASLPAAFLATPLAKTMSLDKLDRLMDEFLKTPDVEEDSRVEEVPVPAEVLLPPLAAFLASLPPSRDPLGEHSRDDEEKGPLEKRWRLLVDKGLQSSGGKEDVLIMIPLLGSNFPLALSIGAIVLENINKVWLVECLESVHFLSQFCVKDVNLVLAGLGLLLFCGPFRNREDLFNRMRADFAEAIDGFRRWNWNFWFENGHKWRRPRTPLPLKSYARVAIRRITLTTTTTPMVLKDRLSSLPVPHPVMEYLMAEDCCISVDHLTQAFDKMCYPGSKISLWMRKYLETETLISMQHVNSNIFR